MMPLPEKLCAVCRTPIGPMRRLTCSPLCRDIYDTRRRRVVHSKPDLAEHWRRGVLADLDRLLAMARDGLTRKTSGGAS